LNWLVLVPVLLAARLLPRLFVSLITTSRFSIERSFPVAANAVLIALILIVLALLTERRGSRWQRVIFCFTIALLLAASILTSLELWHPDRFCVWMGQLEILRTMVPWVGAAAVVIFLVYAAIWRFLKFPARILRFFNAFLLGCTLLAAEVWCLVRHVIPFVTGGARLFVCVAAPLFVLAMVLSGYLITGLPHIDLRDEHREWLRRWGAGC
jgi:hypothetical protein